MLRRIGQDKPRLFVIGGLTFETLGAGRNKDAGRCSGRCIRILLPVSVLWAALWRAMEIRTIRDLHATFTGHSHITAGTVQFSVPKINVMASPRNGWHVGDGRCACGVCGSGSKLKSRLSTNQIGEHHIMLGTSRTWS